MSTVNSTKWNVNPRRQIASKCSRDDLLRKYIFFLHELHFQYAVRTVCVYVVSGCVCVRAEQQQINSILMVKTLRIIQFDWTRARSGWEKLFIFHSSTRSRFLWVAFLSIYWLGLDRLTFPVLIYLIPFPHTIYESESFPSAHFRPAELVPVVDACEVHVLIAVKVFAAPWNAYVFSVCNESPSISNARNKDHETGKSKKKGSLVFTHFCTSNKLRNESLKWKNSGND